MKKLLLPLLLFSLITSFAQTENKYFQQKVDYNIEVILNDSARTLNCFLEMFYQNNSPDTLSYIWFHLWPNAYKNDRTAFSEQLLKNGRTDFYFSSEEERGFINRLDFKVNNLMAVLEDQPAYIDVVKLILPEKLLPGEKILISTPFHVKLPFNFSRGGYNENTFQITQWYPKPAVYDRYGWHPMPYLDQGEFYSEFGDYLVKITLPEEYSVAATGDEVSVEVNYLNNVSSSEMLSDSKLELLDKSVSKKENDNPKTSVQERTKINKPLIPGKSINKKAEGFIGRFSSGNLKTYLYKQENVHDFAWFSDNDFMIQKDTLLLPSGRIIDVQSYYSPSSEKIWKNSLSFIKDAILTRSAWLGEYPYSTAKVVETKMAFAGGMEYPTITNISPVADEKTLDLIIEHEVGHNWNYGVLASNERDHPWLDEGINSYYGNRYESLKYPDEKQNQKRDFFTKRIPDNLMDLGFRTSVKNKNDQPIETKSAEFTETNYGLIAYYKSGLWMKELEKYLGKNALDRAMQEYFNRWKFKHPYPSDFKNVIEEIGGKNVDSIFALLNKRGLIKPPDRKEMKLFSFFNFDQTDKYNYLFLAPAAGLNYYDKLMLGGIVHNYTLPTPDFHFFIAPMYGTGSNVFTGIAKAGYNIRSYGAIRKTEISLSASKFTMNDFKDSTGTNNYMGFYKVVPSIKFTFKNRDANSKMNKYLQWKTYLFEETSLHFSRDTIEHKTIISYPKLHRYLNQLSFIMEDNRALYPYSAKLVAEQGDGFARLALDGQYYFNYPGGGGLDVRLFAGKFFYIGDNVRSNQYKFQRYQLNMTGPNGFEDYTYSNYFVGRSEFDNAPSQQIVIRDGGFKVRTDLLSNKIGKSDDWLSALNFTTDFPKDLNPLQVLPFKIPLKVFLDVGTYSEAWGKNGESEKFLFDAGFQLSLFNQMVNIYVPVFYSKVYNQYFKSTIPKEKRFWQTISFSIDIQNFNFNRFLNIPDF